MPDYRRVFVPGGMYFFTVNLIDRKSDLLVREIDALRSAYAHVEKRHTFETIAICVLRDHLHCIWQLPPDDADFATRWRLIKTQFSKALPRSLDARQGRRTGERGIWQRRYWEHHIRDANDLERHVDYIHWNPVKHGYVKEPEDWPYSTYHAWKEEYGRPVDIAINDWNPLHLEER